MKQINAPRLCYSMNEVIILTGIGRSTIYNEIKAGKLKKTKIGRRTTFTNAALVAWINEHPVVSAAENSNHLPQFPKAKVR